VTAVPSTAHRQAIDKEMACRHEGAYERDGQPASASGRPVYRSME